jgi:hypothetical protein
MTDTEKIMLAAAAGVLLVVLVLVPGRAAAADNETVSSPLTAGAEPGGAGDAPWPAGQTHGCFPHEMSQSLPLPHPLCRQARVPGATRSALMEYGWAWITDPPSEAVL